MSAQPVPTGHTTTPPTIGGPPQWCLDPEEHLVAPIDWDLTPPPRPSFGRIAVRSSYAARDQGTDGGWNFPMDFAVWVSKTSHGWFFTGFLNHQQDYRRNDVHVYIYIVCVCVNGKKFTLWKSWYQKHHKAGVMRSMILVFVTVI